MPAGGEGLNRPGDVCQLAHGTASLCGVGGCQRQDLQQAGRCLPVVKAKQASASGEGLNKPSIKGSSHLERLRCVVSVPNEALPLLCGGLVWPHDRVSVAARLMTLYRLAVPTGSGATALVWVVVWPS